MRYTQPLRLVPSRPALPPPWGVFVRFVSHLHYCLVLKTAVLPDTVRHTSLHYYYLGSLQMPRAAMALTWSAIDTSGSTNLNPSSFSIFEWSNWGQ